jgi:hypothetical protein
MHRLIKTLAVLAAFLPLAGWAQSVSFVNVTNIPIGVAGPNDYAIFYKWQTNKFVWNRQPALDFLNQVTSSLKIVQVTNNSVYLDWQPSPSPDAIGYSVSWGNLSGRYFATNDVGNVTNYTVTGLASGYLYYFGVQAYGNYHTNVSPFSNEAIAFIPGGGGGNPPVISSFVNNQNSVEVGSTVTSTILNWTLAGGAITSQSINQGIGSLATGLRTATDSSSYGTSRTYTLSVSDGTSTITANSSVNFLSQMYWGASSQTAGTITDGQIIALGNSAFATTRATTQTISTANTYIFFCYPASFGAASFTWNGYPDLGWTLVTRSFVNASGASVSYNIYQHTLATIGSFTYQVQ